MDNPDAPPAEPAPPRLWNPNAAANWSLLLTPAFGAALHAANWRTLNRPDRAAANMAWLWVTVVFLAVNLVTVALPDSRAVDAVMRAAGLGLLIGWYVSQGRSQAGYVRDEYGDDYDRRGWGRPLLIALGSILAYLAVAIVIALFTYTPDAAELAAEVQPLILEEWRKKPELATATIQTVTLTHAGGPRYTGFVTATIGGRTQRLPLVVLFEGGTFTWEVMPAAGR